MQCEMITIDGTTQTKHERERKRERRVSERNVGSANVQYVHPVAISTSD